MKVKNSQKYYESFEQFKSELFPNLSHDERVKDERWNPRKLASCLADEAIDQAVSLEKKRASKEKSESESYSE